MARFGVAVLALLMLLGVDVPGAGPDARLAVSAKLDRLVGLTGLDPLDPIYPLAAYRIESVRLGAGDWAIASVWLRYDDGSTRRYRIPVIQSSHGAGLPGGWAYTGIDRVMAPHEELPSLPAGGPNAPIRLGAPARLALHEAEYALSRSGRHVPRGGLSHAQAGDGEPRQTGDLPRLGEDRHVQSPAISDGASPRIAHRCDDALCMVDADGADPVRVDLGAPPPRPPEYLPGYPPPGTNAGPYPPRGPCPCTPPAGAIVVPPPTPSGPSPSRAEFARMRLAWSPRGDRVAALVSDYGKAQPTLWLVDRAGNIERRVAFGPDGLTDTPEWTPDGAWLLVNAFPAGGRRIVAIEAATGRVFDLSQPRWDAFATLSADGQSVLLWNRRGGFWLAPIERG